MDESDAYSQTNETSATSLSVGDNSYIDGQITYKGKTYEASNLYITKASATSGVITMQLTLYFGTVNSNGAYPAAVNVKYSGQAIAQQ